MGENKMSAVMHLPLGAASIDVEHVIVDGSDERAVLATCGEPQRSAMIRAVNCHDDLLAILKRIEAAMDFEASNHPLFDGMQAQINAAIAKAEAQP